MPDAQASQSQGHDEVWKNTHGCEKCNMDDAINPDCPSCHGEGAII